MSGCKIKLKSFTSNRELWIPVTALNKVEALQIAYDRHVLANNSFSPIDETLSEISLDEYKQMISKRQA